MLGVQSKVSNEENTIKCPFCGEDVIHHEDMDFYKCPSCSCEIWPQEQETSPYAGMWEAYRECVHRSIKPGGGGKKSSKKKKGSGPRVISERYLLW